MRVLDMPATGALPEDLREALGNVYATARTYSDSEVHALRAALNIALTYVAPQVWPEMVVQYATEPITYEGVSWGRQGEEWGNWPHAFTIEAGWFYLVCPHCSERCHPSTAADGTEYRRAYTEDELEWSEHDGWLWYGVGDDGDFSSSAEYFLCDRCGQRSSIPEFMSAEY